MKNVLKIGMPIIVLALGLFGAYLIVANAPRVSRANPEIPVTAVETKLLAPTDHQMIVEANGVVIAAKEVDLRAQVSGKIVELNSKLIPGGLLGANEEIAHIESTDYELAVVQQKEAVATALYQLKEEKSQQEIAKEEWALLEDSIPTTEAGKELALRKPQIEKAEAALEAARSKLAQAELDLARTVIKAPFNAAVQTENIDIGQIVNANSDLASLVCTDYFWVQVSIPYDDLQRIKLPFGKADGSKARITLPNSSASAGYEGTVVQLRSDLEEVGRMARLLIRVDDPLGLKSKSSSERKLPLLLGSYVNVEIFSDNLENVYAIPLKAVRDGDEAAAGSLSDRARIWILSGESTLEERDVEIVWQTRDYAYIASGIEAGERLITSQILSPLKGMKLRDIADNAPAPSRQDMERQGAGGEES